MKIFVGLRSLFSPYEFAVGSKAILYTFPVVLILFILSGRGRAAPLLLAIAIVLRLLMEELSRCPVCRRRPSRYYVVDRETGEQVPILRRLWPERQCSGCGTPLDGI